MKKTVILLLSVIVFYGCGSLPDRKSSVSALFSTFKKQARLAPDGQNPQMKTDFRTFLAAKYEDTTVLYYDFSDMVVGSLNEDTYPDFGMQYSAPPLGENDCLQCWEIHQTFFVKNGNHYQLVEEVQTGKGSGGNGSYFRVDSIVSGSIYRTFYNIEEGDDAATPTKDVLQYLNGKILPSFQKVAPL